MQQCRGRRRSDVHNAVGSKTAVCLTMDARSASLRVVPTDKEGSGPDHAAPGAARAASATTITSDRPLAELSESERPRYVVQRDQGIGTVQRRRCENPPHASAHVVSVGISARSVGACIAGAQSSHGAAPTRPGFSPDTVIRRMTT